MRHLARVISVAVACSLVLPIQAAATQSELPWSEIGHFNVPSFQELINVGFVAGKYPHPPLLAGSILFVPGGTFTTSIVIVDVAEPTAPFLVTDYTGISSRAVAMQGESLYSVDVNRFDILDISQLAMPKLVGSLSLNPGGTGAAAVSVAVAGQVAYVTGGGPFLGQFPALQTIDLSVPSTPVPLGASAESGGADVVVRDGYAYVAAYAAGLRIYDVSSPATPTLVGTAGTLGDAGQIRLVGHLAYVFNGGSVFSLAVVDVADPAQPAVLGTVNIPGDFVCGTDPCSQVYFQGIAVSGSTAYATGLHGLLAIDVADPHNPAILGRFGIDEYAGGVAVTAGLAAAVSRSGVSIVCANAATCDDGNHCTNDSCDPLVGCVHTDNSAACNDGNTCTDDSCDPASGCVHSANANACDDGNACTAIDGCAGGLCVGGLPPNCDDASVCTDDSCNPASGCVHTDNSAVCTDDDACTADLCDPVLGCSAIHRTANIDTTTFSENRIDGRDLVVLADAWNTCSPNPRYNAAVDLDPNSTPPGACIDESDFHLFMNAFGHDCP